MEQVCSCLPKGGTAPRTTAGCSSAQGPPLRSWWMPLGWLERKCVRLCVSGLVPDDASPGNSSALGLAASCSLRAHAQLTCPPEDCCLHSLHCSDCRRVPALPRKRWGQLYCSPFTMLLVPHSD